MENKSIREQGLYWVLYDTFGIGAPIDYEWTVAKFEQCGVEGGIWRKIGCDTSFRDDDFIKINEDQLTPLPIR